MKASQRTVFRQTTASQRRLLFETWEQTDNVLEACRKARMGQADLLLLETAV